MMSGSLWRATAAVTAAVVCVSAGAAAQEYESPGDVRIDAPAPRPAPPDTFRLFRSRADSLTSVVTRAAAERARGRRVVVSLAERRLWVFDGRDTLLDAPVAIGMGRTFQYGTKRWRFATPRGVRVVRAKRAAPPWRPPEWAYAEVAREYDLKLARLRADRPVTLPDGRQLVVRDSLVGLMLDDGFAPLPVDEHIVFGSTLYIPPIGTKNRHLIGELGRYQLDLGDGYLLHGTPDESTIGSAVTHGCVRLRAADLARLYEVVPVGTRVYLY